MRRLALIFCLIPAAYFLFSTLYALVFFSDFGASVPHFIRYIAIPGLLAAGFIAAAFYLPDETSFKIGSNTTAVLGALFAFEAVLTIQLVSTLLDTFGVMDKTHISELHAQDGLPPTRTTKQLNTAIGTSSLSGALLGGIPHSRVLLCGRDGKPVVYTADRHGFNNPDSVHEDPVEIIVVGDSFIEGHCLEPGTDVVSRLRTIHPHAVSLGTRGAGPLLELAMLGRFGQQLRPTVVVMAFFEGNDWENLRGEAKRPWLASALDSDADFGPIGISPATLDRAKGAIQNWLDSDVTAFRMVEGTKRVRNFFALQQTSARLGLYYPKAASENPAFAGVMRRAKAITGSWGGTFLLLYIPEMGRFTGLLANGFAFDGLRDIVRNDADTAGVTVIDLVDVLEAREQPVQYFAANGHFSEAGAEMVAQLIAEQVASFGLTRSPAGSGQDVSTSTQPHIP